MWLNKNFEPPALHTVIEPVVSRAQEIIVGKDAQVRLALACLLARGHLLIEDLPGMGKTTLAHVLARLFGLQFNRVQFTSDLLPADIIGASVYDRERATFAFHPGPIFTQVVLADEINRATPKAQSALLEAMEERQVSAEGETRSLPEPFFVIATQNPTDHLGTFPLPESQLDRFLMRIEIGYPDAQAERSLLQGTSRRELLQDLTPVMEAADLLELQQSIPAVHVADALVDYLLALVQHTRDSRQFAAGLSPRASQALLRAAQAWAFMHRRNAVLPEDVQAILPAVVSHRLRPADGARLGNGHEVAADLIQAVAIP